MLMVYLVWCAPKSYNKDISTADIRLPQTATNCLKCFCSSGRQVVDKCSIRFDYSFKRWIGPKKDSIQSEIFIQKSKLILQNIPWKQNWFVHQKYWFNKKMWRIEQGYAKWSPRGLLVVYKWSPLPQTATYYHWLALCVCIYRLKCSKAISGMDGRDGWMGMGWTSERTSAKSTALQC